MTFEEASGMTFEEALARARAEHVVVDKVNQPGEDYRTQYQCRQGCGSFGLIFAENWEAHIVAAADTILAASGEGEAGEPDVDYEQARRDREDGGYEDRAEPPGVVLSEQRDAEKRLRAWLDGVQLSNRLGYPVYANPAELKADLRALLDRKGETG